MNSEPAFAVMRRMYAASVPGSSFLKFFWSWRSLERDTDHCPSRNVMDWSAFAISK